MVALISVTDFNWNQKKDNQFGFSIKVKFFQRFRCWFFLIQWIYWLFGIPILWMLKRSHKEGFHVLIRTVITNLQLLKMRWIKVTYFKMSIIQTASSYLLNNMCNYNNDDSRLRKDLFNVSKLFLFCCMFRIKCLIILLGVYIV